MSSASFDMEDKGNSIFRSATNTLIRTTISRTKQGTPAKKAERNPSMSDAATIQPNMRKFSEHFALLRDTARHSQSPSRPKLPPRKTEIHSKELIHKVKN